MENWIDWVTTERKRVSASIMYILSKSAPKNHYFFPILSTFYNFALKIETSWAKKVVKSILETWKANDIVMYAWLIPLN